MAKCMLMQLPGCLVQSCRLSSCEAFVPLERPLVLWSWRMTIAAGGGVSGAAPLQAAIRSCGYARIAGALPAHGCSGAAPAARVDLHLTGVLVTVWPLLHGCGLVAPLAW